VGGFWAIFTFDLKSGCRDSGLWILNVGSEEWVDSGRFTFDLKSGCRDSGGAKFLI